MAGVCSQGAWGDNNKEPPFLLDIVKYAMWDAWKREKGLDMDLARQKCITMCEIVMRENGLEWAIENQNRPGPSYYSDCGGDTVESDNT